MTKTENYKLNKPDISEQYDINNFNDNADIIDTALHDLQVEVTNDKQDLSNKDKAINKKVDNLSSTVSSNNTAINKKVDNVIAGNTKVKKAENADLATNVKDGNVFVIANNATNISGQKVSFIKQDVHNEGIGTYGLYDFGLKTKIPYNSIADVGDEVYYKEEYIQLRATEQVLYSRPEVFAIIENSSITLVYYTRGDTISADYKSIKGKLKATLKLVNGNLCIKTSKGVTTKIKHLVTYGASPTVSFTIITKDEFDNATLIKEDATLPSYVSDGSVTKIANNCTNVAGNTIATNEGVAGTYFRKDHMSFDSSTGELTINLG